MTPTPRAASTAVEGERETLDDSSLGSFLRAVAFAPHTEPREEERDRTGETIGRFRLTRLLGRGGMGSVYAASDLTLRREVALKLLRAEAVGNEERRRRFSSEARSAAAVSHPNIAAVFEAGEDSGEVFLVMELVAGRSLRAALEEAKGALPEGEATRIARGIARGLAAAHAAGVIHRDIKPENVMVADGDEIKILDFGLAKLRGAEDAPSAFASTDLATHEGRILGTPSYMSPEQARGLPADARSDVFAFGVVVFEMLAGKRPFRGETVTDVLAAIVRDEPPELEGTSEPLRGVVMRCLAKAPGDRFPDARAVLEALEPRAAPTETRARSHSPRSRRSLLFALVGAGVVLVAANLFFPPGPVPLRLPPPPGWEPPGLPLEAPPESAPFATAPKPRPTTIVDLPLPPSQNAGALEAYKAALQSFRDANWGNAEVSLRKAIALDPSLAAAHMRLACVLAPPGFSVDDPEAAAAYREAMRLRGTLTPRDGALLSALEPALGADPRDTAETVRRLTQLSTNFPLDAEIFALLSFYLAYDAPERRIAAARRAVELDPQYADAWQAVGLALADRDPNGALDALGRCTDIAPTATDCWGERANIEGVLGRCADAEAHLRRATNDPNASTYSFNKRANMLHALGKPAEAVTEVFRQKWARTTAKEELYDRALLAAAYGDFDAARKRTAEGLALVDALPALPAHARFALLAVDIEIEIGHPERAAAIEMDFLNRRDGWQPGTPSEDPTLYFTRLAARGGALSEADLGARREAWSRAWTPATALQKALRWQAAYAKGIERADEAAEALAARPADALWSSISASTLDEDLGRALWLGGKRDEALPHLERAFTRCERLPRIMQATRADLFFGRALEERGDRGRACEVYKTILARWGKAKPRSITAADAKKRAQALGCEAKRR